MKQTYLDPSFLLRLEGIDWFAHCGEPLQISVEMRVHQLVSLRLAVKAYHKQIWEDTTLDARNTLTMYLNRVASARFNLWNDITDVAKGYMREHLEPEWVKFQQQHELDQAFIHTVQWDVLSSHAKESRYFVPT